MLTTLESDTLSNTPKMAYTKDGVITRKRYLLEQLVEKTLLLWTAVDGGHVALQKRGSQPNSRQPPLI
jgi:hypothetical protein